MEQKNIQQLVKEPKSAESLVRQSELVDLLKQIKTQISDTESIREMVDAGYLGDMVELLNNDRDQSYYLEVCEIFYNLFHTLFVNHPLLSSRSFKKDCVKLDLKERVKDWLLKVIKKTDDIKVCKRAYLTLGLIKEVINPVDLDIIIPDACGDKVFDDQKRKAVGGLLLSYFHGHGHSVINVDMQKINPSIIEKISTLGVEAMLDVLGESDRDRNSFYEGINDSFMCLKTFLVNYVAMNNTELVLAGCEALANFIARIVVYEEKLPSHNSRIYKRDIKKICDSDTINALLVVLKKYPKNLVVCAAACRALENLAKGVKNNNDIKIANVAQAVKKVYDDIINDKDSKNTNAASCVVAAWSVLAQLVLNEIAAAVDSRSIADTTGVWHVVNIEAINSALTDCKAYPSVCAVACRVWGYFFHYHNQLCKLPFDGLLLKRNNVYLNNFITHTLETNVGNIIGILEENMQNPKDCLSACDALAHTLAFCKVVKNYPSDLSTQNNIKELVNKICTSDNVAIILDLFSAKDSNDDASLLVLFSNIIACCDDAQLQQIMSKNDANNLVNIIFAILEKYSQHADRCMNALCALAQLSICTDIKTIIDNEKMQTILDIFNTYKDRVEYQNLDIGKNVAQIICNRAQSKATSIVIGDILAMLSELTVASELLGEIMNCIPKSGLTVVAGCRGTMFRLPFTQEATSSSGTVFGSTGSSGAEFGGAVVPVDHIDNTTDHHNDARDNALIGKS